MKIGNYEVEEFSEGIYRGRDAETGLYVVLKGEPWEKCWNPDIKQGDWRKLQRAARQILAHEFMNNLAVAGNPYIVQPVELGVTDHHDIQYIVTEDAGRDTLFEVSEAGEKRTLIRSLAQVANALHHAHKKGIIHRDVKPENVAVSDKARLLDWECSHKLSGDSVDIHCISQGTSGYMSPEQERFEKPTAAEDVFGYSAMAFTCLTKSFPYEWADEAEEAYDFDKPVFEENTLDEFGDFGRKVIKGLSYSSKDRPQMKELAKSAVQLNKSRKKTFIHI